jgi:hypothetical protein
MNDIKFNLIFHRFQLLSALHRSFFYEEIKDGGRFKAQWFPWKNILKRRELVEYSLLWLKVKNKIHEIEETPWIFISENWINWRSKTRQNQISLTRKICVRDNNKWKKRIA